MNLEIQKLKSINEELMESKLKAVRKKSDYEKKCEQLEAELKTVRKEKSDYKEKCERLEAELNAVRKEKSEKCERQEAELKAMHKEKPDYVEKREQQELEVKGVKKQILKKSEQLEREKTLLVLQEGSKDHIDAIMAGSSVTDIELDIASDGELHCICNYGVFMH